MPKLAAKDRKKVEKSEAVSGGFELLKPGKYVAELTGVEAKASAAGNPMWVAEFSEIHNLDGERMPGRQWYNLNLPTTDTPPDGYVGKGKKSAEESWAQYQALCSGRIKAFFEAFGFTPDSDTDEMIGERCVIQIGVRTIQQGARAGEQANSLNGVAPLDSVDYEGEDDADDADNF
jgi:hypothetical protein